MLLSNHIITSHSHFYNVLPTPNKNNGRVYVKVVHDDLQHVRNIHCADPFGCSLLSLKVTCVTSPCGIVTVWFSLEINVELSMPSIFRFVDFEVSVLISPLMTSIMKSAGLLWNSHS